MQGRWQYAVVWVRGLLMATLWVEWPMVAVGLWYEQGYAVDNEHMIGSLDGILLMIF